MTLQMTIVSPSRQRFSSVSRFHEAVPLLKIRARCKTRQHRHASLKSKCDVSIDGTQRIKECSHIVRFFLLRLDAA